MLYTKLGILIAFLKIQINYGPKHTHYTQQAITQMSQCTTTIECHSHIEKNTLPNKACRYYNEKVITIKLDIGNKYIHNYMHC